MGLTIDRILNKFEDCNKFSLSDKRTNCKVTEKEFTDAIMKAEEYLKEERRKYYNKEDFKDYPSFDEIYDEVKKECINFDNDENKNLYLKKHFDEESINLFKKQGFSDEKIDEIKKDFFRCSFIAEHVGKTTKYGKEHRGFFWNLYHNIGMIVDLEKKKKLYCYENKLNPLEHIPNELKSHLLYYEVSFFNKVTFSEALFINYYFDLNEETKKYLLKFRNDFCLKDLEDLALYKDSNLKFSSCTHECYNSIDLDYKNMTIEEIKDYINDKYYNENNKVIIDTMNMIIFKEEDNKFTFKELGINKKVIMEKICTICEEINLKLISAEEKEHEWKIPNIDGTFEKIESLPAFLCDVDTLIEKKR